MNRNIIKKKINQIRKSNKTIGLCHGVFDLIHYGHIKHFESAKKNVIICMFLLPRMSILKKVL